MAVGYSGTPLWKKLGIKEGFRIYPCNPPPHYQDLLADLPHPVKLLKRSGKSLDMVHLFTASRTELEKSLKRLRHHIKDDGMIWVSWPKKSSGIKSEITEDTIREVCLPMGLVDIKVCAVDDTWSGLKLVVRKEFRGV